MLHFWVFRPDAFHLPQKYILRRPRANQDRRDILAERTLANLAAVSAILQLTVLQSREMKIGLS